PICALAEKLCHLRSALRHVTPVDSRDVTKAVQRLTVGETHEKISGPEVASSHDVATVSRTPLGPLLVLLVGNELDHPGLVVQEIGTEPIEHDIERRGLCLADPDESRTEDEGRQRRMYRSISRHGAETPR